MEPAQGRERTIRVPARIVHSLVDGVRPDRLGEGKIGQGLFGRGKPILAHSPGSVGPGESGATSRPGTGVLRLETDRLILRTFCLDDLSSFSELLGDPANFLFSERRPMSETEAWNRLLCHFGHWSAMGHGLFAVEEKASACLVGEVGLGDFRRGLGPAFDLVPEASWTIAGWGRGRGYATEAAAAAQGWIEGHVGVRRTVCLTHSGNQASLRVAAKLGYSAFAERDYRGFPALLLERTAG